MYHTEFTPYFNTNAELRRSRERHVFAPKREQYWW